MDADTIIKGLYEEGFDDKEIAAILRVKASDVYNWRRDYNLPPNMSNRPKRQQKTNLKPKKKTKKDYRLEFYKLGLNDRQIAKEVGLHIISIYQWRIKRGYPQQKNKTIDMEKLEEVRKLQEKVMATKEVTKIPQEIERERLYNAGLSDMEIANEQNIHCATVQAWRHNNNLPPNFEQKQEMPISEDLKDSEENRMKLYKEGLSDMEIARIFNLHYSTIHKWRMLKNLPPNINRQLTAERQEKESQRMELYEKGLTDKEISQRLGTDVGTISTWRIRRKLPVNKKVNPK